LEFTRLGAEHHRRTAEMAMNKDDLEIIDHNEKRGIAERVSSAYAMFVTPIDFNLLQPLNSWKRFIYRPNQN
jgi:hypothetical protein